jgi:hypothetical protein
MHSDPFREKKRRGIREPEDMHDLRSKKRTLKQHESKSVKTVSKWIDAQCCKISGALSAANDEDEAGLWDEADVALSEFKSLYPEIMLSNEIAKFIRDLRPLAPDLWNIVAEYATSHRQARSAGASKILWLRIGCLHMSGRSAMARPLESCINLESANECEMYHEWGIRLFYNQHFDDAKRIFQKLSDSQVTYPQPACPIMAIVCSIFIGEFDAARTALQTVNLVYPPPNQDHALCGWLHIARSIVIVSEPLGLPVRTVARTTLLNFPPILGCYGFPRRFITNLLQKVSVEFKSSFEGNERYAFNAEFLQAKFASTVDECKRERENGNAHGNFAWRCLFSPFPPSLSRSELGRKGRTL